MTDMATYNRYLDRNIRDTYSGGGLIADLAHAIIAKHDLVPVGDPTLYLLASEVGSYLPAPFYDPLKEDTVDIARWWSGRTTQAIRESYAKNTPLVRFYSASREIVEKYRVDMATPHPYNTGDWAAAHITDTLRFGQQYTDLRASVTELKNWIRAAANIHTDLLVDDIDDLNDTIVFNIRNTDREAHTFLPAASTNAPPAPATPTS